MEVALSSQPFWAEPAVAQQGGCSTKGLRHMTRHKIIFMASDAKHYSALYSSIGLCMHTHGTRCMYISIQTCVHEWPEYMLYIFALYSSTYIFLCTHARNCQTLIEERPWQSFRSRAWLFKGELQALMKSAPSFVDDFRQCAWARNMRQWVIRAAGLVEGLRVLGTGIWFGARGSQRA